MGKGGGWGYANNGMGREGGRWNDPQGGGRGWNTSRFMQMME